MRKNKKQFKTLLVSAPFMRPTLPLMAISVLKSAIASKGWHVACLHLPLFLLKFMNYGDYYQAFQTSDEGDIWYSRHIYTSKSDRRLLSKPDLGISIERKVEANITAGIRKFNEYVATHLFKKTYDVVGFSVSEGQLTASLYFAKLYKELHPKAKIVFGGPQCTGGMGASIVEVFPWIDYAVHGEGEKPLIEILESVFEGDNRRLDGCSARSGGKIVSVPPSSVIDDLDSLPTPDHSDYFEQYAQCGAPCPVVCIPVELNRGCWWGKCAYCAYYRNRPYREFSPSKVCEIIDELADKHLCLNYFIMSNVGYRSLQALSSRLKKSKRDLSLKMSHRATVSRDELEALREGGLKEIAFGIESLSTSLLKKMQKGVSAIQNIQSLKNAEKLGIRESAPLIYGFPGETKREFGETIASIKKCWHLMYDFEEVKFALQYDTIAYRNPKRYGIVNIRPDQRYQSIYPPKHFDALVHFQYQFNCTKSLRGSYRAALEADSWPGSKKPQLVYQDGANFLVVIDKRRQDATVEHRLASIQRKLFLYCDTIRTINDIKRHCPNVSKRDIESNLSP